MDSKGVQFLDSTVCNTFLGHAYSGRDFNDLTKRDRDMIKAVEVLMEFINTGTISPRKEAIVLNGTIGILMTQYLAYKENQRLARNTLDEYAQHLSRFLAFLTKKEIKEIKAVDQLHVLQYLKEIDPKCPSLPYMALRAIRGLFKYLHEQELLETDISLFIPKTKYNKQPKLPSTYHKHEVETLVNSIDRSSRTGKRNYAIILLAARLGLRASDIRNLKFDEIHWKKNIIRIKQYKTDNILENYRCSRPEGYVMEGERI
jgi:integrase